MSSLAFLVGVRDVMGAAKIEGANTFQFFECYACVMLIYWVITLILTAFQKYWKNGAMLFFRPFAYIL